MPRPRNPENRGLPARWQKAHGAIYYQVPPGLEHLWNGKKKFRLGKTLPEAYRTWAGRLSEQENIATIDQLLERYLREVVPKKAIRTQAENTRYIVRLRSVFGRMPLNAIRPQHIYQYVDRRVDVQGKPVKTQAHREIEVLSHAFTRAVEWGLIDRHPFKGEVRLEGEPSRKRYVEDWELDEVLALSAIRKKGSVRMIQAYLRVKLLTGLRRGDLLRLQPARHFKEDGIHIEPHKTMKTTKKALIIEWTDELRAAVQAALDARPVEIAPWLFCTDSGECYIDEEKGTASGWDSMWKRFFDRVLKETKVTERFTEHDIRAKTGSDFADEKDAQQLLGHADVAMTRKAYRRKAQKVKPLR